MPTGMPDDERGPIDRKRIDVNDAHDVQYWAQALRVTEDQIRKYVRRVGPEAADVRLAIAKDKLRDTLRITTKTERDK